MLRYISVHGVVLCWDTEEVKLDERGVYMYFSGVNPFKMLVKDPDMFWKFYPAAATRMAFKIITGKKLRSPIYAGHRVLSQSKGNEILKEALKDDKPFMFGRHGSNELLCAGTALMAKRGIITEVDGSKLAINCSHCGLFPSTSDTIIRFHELIQGASEQCDLYGTFRMVWEDYYIKHFMKKDVVLTHLNMMDFWRYEEPFTCSLKGQKVLVVHPLAAQIEHQYEKREKLFANPSVLPEFELKTLQAVQTIAGERDPRFTTWFDALEYMTDEIKKIDFDVALLGCGAYGMPLAAEIKKMGKKVVYMGGVLQMLFGIRGKRWDDMPEAAALYNEYWETPRPDMIPKNAADVEGGCYW